MKYLVIGLGNIGAEYTLTRHNLGFMVLDQLAKEQGISFQIDRLAAVATYKYRGRTLFLIKPSTYMNHSGRAVSYWLGKLKVPTIQSLVIVDDVALPFGKLRVRAQGSSAGHNGLKSIEASLGSQAYPRLRIGIGNDFLKGKQAEYVLSKFNAKEQEALPAFVVQACQIVHVFCTLGIGHVMEQYNVTQPIG